MVMDATGDYWKPFYYLLEDTPFTVELVKARHVKTILAARPMCPTWRGWRSSAPSGLCGGRSCLANRSRSSRT